MGMDHLYDFFDHEAFDPIWRLSWAEFVKKHRTRWASNPEFSANESLRGLISFSINPEPFPSRSTQSLPHFKSRIF